MIKKGNTLCVFSFDYPPNDGGIARLCSAIVMESQRRGHPTQVLTKENENGCVTIGSEGTISEVRLVPQRPLCEWKALRMLQKKAQNQVVICGRWYPEGLVATLARARPRVILALGAEIFPTRAWWRRFLWKHLQRWVLESADLVLAISEYTQNLVTSAAPRARAVNVPPGVDHRRFSPGDREAARRKFQVSNQLVLCSVSRIHAFKGHETVLEALAALPDKIRNATVYLVAGQGPHLAKLQQRAEELEIETQVRWLGFLKEDDLPDLYRAADLFVLCTHEVAERQAVEGFGLVFLEAQACGTPVVGTHTGGIPDTIKEGEGGWLIEQGDAAALASILLQLARDPISVHKMGLTARRRIERECTWEHYSERLSTELARVGIFLD